MRSADDVDLRPPRQLEGAPHPPPRLHLQRNTNANEEHVLQLQSVPLGLHYVCDTLWRSLWPNDILTHFLSEFMKIDPKYIEIIFLLGLALLGLVIFWHTFP